MTTALLPAPTLPPNPGESAVPPTLAQAGSPTGAASVREQQLGAIIEAYSRATEQLREAHDRLSREVVRLREELEDKNRMLRRRERLAALGELAAGMAHEIRNPLAAIQLFTSLLERDLGERPDQLRVVRKIARGVSSLEAIVTDILEFGRPREAVRTRVALDVICREVVEWAGPRLGSVRLEVEAEKAASIVLLTDAAMLQRALLNLVLNAIEAAGVRGPQGQVILRVERLGDGEVALSVLDNGPGIAAENLERIFNPFFTTREHGTGLGLAIVHQIVETLGGTVQAGNRPEGGAVFSIRLPLEPPVDQSMLA